MQGRKRKRSDEDGQIPTKKPSVRHNPSDVTLSIVKGAGDWQPILGTSPGIEFTAQTRFEFDVYSKYGQATEDGQLPELLLYSGRHPKLDYIAREEQSNTANDRLRHYIGIYDPDEADVKVIPARKLVVRSILRNNKTLEEDIEAIAPAKGHAARAILGEAFGTKKSQKAIRALTENAITTPGHKTNEEGKPILNASAAAVLDTVAEASISMPSRADMISSMDEAKPRPKANMEAEVPSQVYSIQDLVGAAAFECFDIRSIEKGGEFAACRFAKRRMADIKATRNKEQLKALFYLNSLVLWFRCLKSVGKDRKKIPKKEDIGKSLSYASELLPDIIRKRFAPDFDLTRWHIDYLITHICALAIVLDNCNVEISDLQKDLSLDTQEISRYFKEIGCRIGPPTEKERREPKFSDELTTATKFARLRIPLQFPMPRKPKAKR